VGTQTALARLVAVCAVTAVAGASLLGPATADEGPSLVTPSSTSSADSAGPSPDATPTTTPATPTPTTTTPDTKTPVPLTAPSPESVSPRGDIVGRIRGVPVRKVTVSKSGRLVTAKVFWNQGLIKRKGNRDRFNVRVVAFPAGDGAPIMLTNRSKTTTPPPVQKIRIKLSKNKAKKLRAASDAVLTVSQQHGKTKSKRFNRAYVTVTKLTATNGRALSARSLATDTRAGRDCMARLIRPGANLAGCDLAAASLRDGVISRANLTGADLSAGLLSGSVVEKTKLAGANLSGVDASGLSGTPASLPAGWTLVNGELVPPNPSPPAPSAQTITFPGLANTEFGVTPPVLAATASSGLAVSYTSSTAPVCTTTGPGVITFVSLGTCTINADQVGDGTWAAAPQVPQSFEVTSCATGGGAAGTCALGDVGPGGGIVFYVNPANTPGSNYMEAAPNTWNGGSADPSFGWCSNTETFITGTFGTAIGTGKANTDNMVAAGACTSGAANSVRAYAGALSAGSWSLPSLDELNELDVLGGGGLTAFALYWSSSQSESDAGRAWGQDVGYGGGSDHQFTGSKSFTGDVRPVRAF
jgi:hypothetical protein